MEFLEDTVIKTALNDREVRTGHHGLIVHGYGPSSKTVYQSHGCYWHDHGCSIDSSKTIGDRHTSSHRKDTLDKENYLQHLGYEVTSIWECEWRRLVKGKATLKLFLEAFFDVCFGNQRSYTEEELINSIRHKEIFGFVECDIQVPSHLHGKFSEIVSDIQERLSLSLSRSDLSSHMETFAEENDFLK